MLNPKDISEIKFDKVIVGGYDMGAVDDFLDQVEKDYTQLVSENNLLKSKLRQLVKKIEEYRSMDESMRKALGSAQTMAAQIVDKAKQEANSIRAGAQRSGDEVLAEYQTRIAAEEQKLTMAKASVQDFVARMTTMYSQGAEMLQTIVGKSADEEPVIPKAAPVAAPAPRAATHFEPTPKPVEPLKPAEQPKPVVPPRPVQPVRPAEPPKPAQPQIPVEEPKPVEPQIPVEPPKPVEPQIPVEEPKPIEPQIPVEPPKPVEPQIPVEPPKPVEPQIPVEPPKPVEPQIPVQPQLPVEEPKPVEAEPIPELVIPEAKPVFTVSEVLEPTILDTDHTGASAPVDLSGMHDPFPADEAVSKPIEFDESALRSGFDTLVENVQRENVKPKLADTAQLPNLPPIPEEKPRPSFTTGRVYPNSIVRHSAEEADLFDDGETIHLTPKPKFEFDNLQFGDNYDKK